MILKLAGKCKLMKQLTRSNLLQHSHNSNSNLCNQLLMVKLSQCRTRVSNHHSSNTHLQHNSIHRPTKDNSLLRVSNLLSMVSLNNSNRCILHPNSKLILQLSNKHILKPSSSLWVMVSNNSNLCNIRDMVSHSPSNNQWVMDKLSRTLMLNNKLTKHSINHSSQYSSNPWDMHNNNLWATINNSLWDTDKCSNSNQWVMLSSNQLMVNNSNNSSSKITILKISHGEVNNNINERPM